MYPNARPKTALSQPHQRCWLYLIVPFEVYPNSIAARIYAEMIAFYLCIFYFSFPSFLPSTQRRYLSLLDSRPDSFFLAKTWKKLEDERNPNPDEKSSLKGTCCGDDDRMHSALSTLLRRSIAGFYSYPYQTSTLDSPKLLCCLLFFCPLLSVMRRLNATLHDDNGLGWKLLDAYLLIILPAIIWRSPSRF